MITIGAAKTLAAMAVTAIYPVTLGRFIVIGSVVIIVIIVVVIVVVLAHAIIVVPEEFCNIIINKILIADYGMQNIAMAAASLYTFSFIFIFLIFF